MGLLDAQELVIDQVTSVFSSDSDVSEHGEVVGTITTEGDLASRFFTGNREFSVTAYDGTPVLRLVDVPNFGRDTFEVWAHDGTLLGTLRREMSLFAKRISFLPGDGGQALEVRGSFWDYDYQILVDREPMAAISQQWAGLGRALMGGQRYAVSFAHTTDERTRRVILGVVIVIDLMKAKDKRRSASSSS